MILPIDYNVIIPVRLIAVPQLIPPFPIGDVVGIELKISVPTTDLLLCFLLGKITPNHDENSI